MTTASLLAYRPHDHQRCVAQAMNRARERCEERGLRLTLMRKQVLELIWASHKALGAYDLLALMAHGGKKIAPPTVYRALDFLLDTGLIHRIATLNAYIGCSILQAPHCSCLLICRQCLTVQEKAHPQLEQLLRQPEVLGEFVAESSVIEVSGLCPGCAEAPLKPEPAHHG